MPICQKGPSLLIDQTPAIILWQSEKNKRPKTKQTV